MKSNQPRHNGRDPTGIVVLFNMTEKLIKGEPRDLIADQAVIGCAEAVSHALEQTGHRVAMVPLKGDLERTLAPYPSREWLVFNLAEGLSGLLFEEARIAWALEAMGYTFTGSRGEALARSLDKSRTKQLLVASGVETPAWWVFREADEVEVVLDDLRFPLIVKPVAEDASLGIDSKAVVHSVSELQARVAYIMERYRQTALVEAFIAGREFNVSLMGHPPAVMPLAEIDFSHISDPLQRIVSFSAKWEQDSFEYHHTPVLCPAPASVGLAESIRHSAQRSWDAIGCQGYARVDMRIDETETPYVVEVNCNPDLSPDAGFYRAASAAGYDYRNMVAEIVEAAKGDIDA